MRPPELILASTSPYRVQLLRSAGIEARPEAPHVDEAAIWSADPVELARERARAKARAVAARFPGARVIGADQVGFDLDGDRSIFGKPENRADQMRRLQAMRGRRHALVTAVVLASPRGEIVEHSTSTLGLRADLTDAELQAYVDTGEGEGCAGGYAAEGRGIFLFDHIDGDWTNIIGLPMVLVITLLRREGWRFPDAS